MGSGGKSGNQANLCLSITESVRHLGSTWSREGNKGRKGDTPNLPDLLRALREIHPSQFLPDARSIVQFDTAAEAREPVNPSLFMVRIPQEPTDGGRSPGAMEGKMKYTLIVSVVAWLVAGCSSDALNTDGPPRSNASGTTQPTATGPGTEMGPGTGNNQIRR